MNSKDISSKLVRAGVAIGLGLIALSFTRGFFKSAGKDIIDAAEGLSKKFGGEL